LGQRGGEADRWPVATRQHRPTARSTGRRVVWGGARDGSLALGGIAWHRLGRARGMTCAAAVGGGRRQGPGWEDGRQGRRQAVQLGRAKSWSRSGGCGNRGRWGCARLGTTDERVFFSFSTSRITGFNFLSNLPELPVFFIDTDYTSSFSTIYRNYANDTPLDR
jgi:hypothetical protein